MRILILVLSLIIPSLSFACSCGKRDIKKIISTSKYIFVAGIKSVTINDSTKDHMKGVVAEFVLIDSIKGNAKEIKKLYSGFGGGDCGVPLNVGWQYIIYSNDGVVAVCSGSNNYPGKENDDGYVEKIREYLKNGTDFDPEDFFLIIPSDENCQK